MRLWASIDFSALVANVVVPAAITIAGAWVLVGVVGTVAVLAVLLTVGVYAPLRCRYLA